MSRSLRSFLESHIAVPDTMYCFRGGKLQREIVPQGDLYVIYVAPSACSSCAISQLSSYAGLSSLGDSLGFSALILLSPQEGSETEVLHTLSSRNLDIPVWLDIDHRFFDDILQYLRMPVSIVSCCLPVASRRWSETR